MDILFNLPVWVRDMGVFVTIALSLMLLLAYSPFAFRISFEGQFIVGKNGQKVRDLAHATEPANPSSND